MRRTFAALGMLVLSLSAFASNGVWSNPPPVAAGQQAFVSCGTPDDRGLIVHLDVEDRRGTPEAGDVETSLIVYLPDGSQLHRVPLSTFPSVNNPIAACTILINGTDIGPALFDALTGELLPLVFPAGYDDSPLYPFNGWQRTYKEQRFALLSDGTPNQVLLADVQSGHTIDLETLVYLLRGDESRLLLILGAALSQDESTLLLMTDRDTWLVPTANPTGARPLTGAARGTAALSEDGMKVVYGTASEERASDVVVENLDGSDRTVVADGGMRPFSYWLPGSGGRQLLGRVRKPVGRGTVFPDDGGAGMMPFFGHQ